MRTLWVLFFIELSPRRVHVAGATAEPDSAWVTQQARNLGIEDRLGGVRFLLRDRDAKFSGPFDEVFHTEGARIIRNPIRAPRANAFAERFVRTIRTECLDHMLIYGRRHLEHVLRIYVTHYLNERPHRGLRLATPSGRPSAPVTTAQRNAHGARDRFTEAANMGTAGRALDEARTQAEAAAADRFAAASGSYWH